MSNATLASLPRASRWLLAGRIKTLGLSLTPVAFGSVLAWQSGAFRPEVALLAALSAALIQIGTNLWNDAQDGARGLDRPDRLGPPRMTALGLLEAGAVRRAALSCFAGAAGAGAFLLPFGGWPILLLGLVSLALGLAYSSGPRPLSGEPVGEILVIGFFGIAAVAGTLHLHGAPVTGRALALGALLGLPAAAVLLLNNHRDRAGDARAGRRTLALLLGPRLTCALYALLLAAALAGAWAAGLRAGVAGGLALAAIGLSWRVATTPISRHLNAFLPLTVAWQAALAVALALAA